MDKYKFSMFAKLFPLNDKESILYSSYLGTDKMIKLSEKSTKTVQEWIKNGCIERTNDNLLLKLVSLGYFVNINVNEKVKRQELINSVIYDNYLKLVVHTTEDCNFRCEYCSLEFEKKKLSPIVETSIISYIRKNITKYRGVHISWFGGEPLLNIGSIERITKEVIKICNNAKRSFSASITTNGFLLSKKNIELLYNCMVHNIIVTVDGLKATHDFHRHLVNGGPTFDHIIANLKHIKNNKKYHINVIIRTNFTKEIYENVQEYYHFFDKEFGDDSRFSLFVRLAGDWGGERVKAIRDNLLTDNYYKELFDRLSNIENMIHFEQNRWDLEPAGSACSAMRKNKYTIAVDGSVHKCDTPNLPIGFLDSAGRMHIDENKNCLWSNPHDICSEACDNCFFSCACFLGVCPKNIIHNQNNYKCNGILSEVQSIACTIANTKNLETI